MSDLFEAPENNANMAWQQAELVEQSRIQSLTDRARQLIGRSAVAVSLAIAGGAVAGAGEAMLDDATPAYAATFSNDYPDGDAVDCSGKFGIYSWCKDENGSGQYEAGEATSPRGYDYRNCTDGVAYWVKKYTGVDTGGWGNAKDWDTAAPADKVIAGTTSGNIEPGDVAQSDDGGGGFGHVEFVTSVTKNTSGTVTSFTTAALNQAGTGNYTGPNVNIYSTRNAAGKFSRGGANDWDHFIDVNGAGKGLDNETWPAGGGGAPAPGTETIGSYNPSAAVFHERNSNTPGPADMPVAYGNANWIPLAGDWNNDRVFTPGAYDPATGIFHLSNSNVPGGPADTPAFQYGNIGWVPIAGDWDGNGYWSIGMYDPATSTFYLRNTNSAGGADTAFSFGNTGWKPITGDWDGHDDGNAATTVGVYNPSTATYYLNNENDGSAAESTIQYGNVGWVPLGADWDGNGFSSIGAYDPNTATFYLRNANSPGPADVTVQYGVPGWKPISGDWDGQ